MGDIVGDNVGDGKARGLPDGLTPRQIIALSYYYYDSLSVADISERLGISRQCCYRLINRGKKHIEQSGVQLHRLKPTRPKIIYIDPNDLDKIDNGTNAPNNSL